jgi:hypothetical protein
MTGSSQVSRQAAGHSDHAGVGVGLAIVNSITRDHDGSLTLSPRDGGGLQVTVQLPLRDRSVHNRPQRGNGARVRSGQGRAEPERRTSRTTAAGSVNWIAFWQIVEVLCACPDGRCLSRRVPKLGSGR